MMRRIFVALAGLFASAHAYTPVTTTWEAPPFHGARHRSNRRAPEKKGAAAKIKRSSRKAARKKGKK